MAEYVCDVLVPVAVTVEAESPGEAEVKALERIFAPVYVGRSVYGEIQLTAEKYAAFGITRSDSDVQVEVGEA